jgi:hypothetical protein
MAAWSVGGCEQCSGGEGVCVVDAPALTTVWSWLDDVNDSAFAGHSDWRLPTSGGFAGSTGEPSELDSLADARFVSGVNPALEPSSLQAWSASTTPGGPPFLAAAKVIFPSQQIVEQGKETAVQLRAIR